MLGPRRLLMLGLYLSDHRYYELEGDPAKPPPLFYGYDCGHVLLYDYLAPAAHCPTAGCQRPGERIPDIFFSPMRCKECRTYLYYPSHEMPLNKVTCRHPRGHQPEPFTEGG
ncbi:hypothetical protein SAMN04488564_1295 [Lentzea waywayandensis]|uniref:Uncharacterized protein n=1 Tax=Lentzea waywayandensis TaxID=84724 RepID=A0A1I6FJL9_9PSEU|nr:hypothetical protein SAMN04488564_1295 [Lentzea waywayandensis]